MIVVSVRLQEFSWPFHETAEKEGIAHAFAQLQKLREDCDADVFFVLEIDDQVFHLVRDEPIMDTHGEFRALTTIVAKCAYVDRVEHDRAINNLGDEVHVVIFLRQSF